MGGVKKALSQRGRAFLLCVWCSAGRELLVWLLPVSEATICHGWNGLA
jgi:hypothetical protein